MTLLRYKKMGERGFKSFVRSFETNNVEISIKKFYELFLEDPVYLTWVAKNVLTYLDFLNLDGGEILEILDKLGDPIDFIFKISAKTKYEKDFLAVTPPKYYKDLKELMEFEELKVKASDQKSKQVQLVKIMRTMIDKERISSKGWRMPLPSVVNYNKYQKIDGSFESFYDDEQIAVKGTLKNRKRDGFWQFYYSDGILMAEGDYQKDKKNGLWTFFYPDGSFKEEGNFVNDLKVGVWKEWDSNGKINSSLIEEKGKVLSRDEKNYIKDLINPGKCLITEEEEKIFKKVRMQTRKKPKNEQSVTLKRIEDDDDFQEYELFDLSTNGLSFLNINQNKFEINEQLEISNICNKKFNISGVVKSIRIFDGEKNIEKIGLKIKLEC